MRIFKRLFVRVANRHTGCRAFQGTHDCKRAVPVRQHPIAAVEEHALEDESDGEGDRVHQARDKDVPQPRQTVSNDGVVT